MKTLFLARLESGQAIICRKSQIHQLTIRLLTLLVFLISFWKEKDRVQVFMFVNLFFFCLLPRRGRPHWNKPSSIQLQPFVTQKGKRKKKYYDTGDTGDTWHMTFDKWHMPSDMWWGVNTLSNFSFLALTVLKAQELQCLNTFSQRVTQ